MLISRLSALPSRTTSRGTWCISAMCPLAPSPRTSGSFWPGEARDTGERSDSQRFVYFIRIIDHAILHHELDGPNGADVLGRVARYQKKVGPLATLEGAIQLVPEQV